MASPSVKVHSYYIAIVLRCHNARSCDATALRCRMKVYLNLKCRDAAALRCRMKVSFNLKCGDAAVTSGRDVIDIYQRRNTNAVYSAGFTTGPVGPGPRAQDPGGLKS